MTNSDSTPLYQIERQGDDSNGYWVADGGGISGHILFCWGEKFSANDQGAPRALATPSIAAELSALAKGARSSNKALVSDSQGKFHPMLYVLNFVLAPEKPEFLKERASALLGSQPGMNQYVKFMVSERYSDLHPNTAKQLVLEEFARQEIFRAIRQGGQYALSAMTVMAKALESKRRPLSPEENGFLKSVCAETERVAAVPKIKDVRDNWLSARAGRTEEQFKRIRKALGFGWLPEAPRGRKRGRKVE